MSIGKSECLDGTVIYYSTPRSLDDESFFRGKMGDVECTFPVPKEKADEIRRFFGRLHEEAACKLVEEAHEKIVRNHAHMQNEPWRRQGKRRGHRA